MSKLEELVKEAHSIAISGHIRPDGDCIGSVLATCQYLKKNTPDKEVRVFLESPGPEFSCIQGIEEIDTQMESEKVYDLFFILDCSLDRIGKALPIAQRAKKRINIDHHISNEGTGDINILEPMASSTSEVVFGLMDVTKLDEEIAKALYLGLVHDTGVFKYSNTSPGTLRIAAELISFGFDFPKLIDETFYEMTYEQNQILGRALTSSRRILENRCIVSVVEASQMEECGVTPGDLDGVVSQLRITKGVECAVFLYQTGEQEYKVSLRSNHYVNVAEIAASFGGGGHIRAAGCSMVGSPPEIIEQVAKRIALQLKKEE
ncbi:MAG: bifunctional oligoribonuclease/PAP phosphatase NrnA [Lachnospiraceae bacterium]|nr:bifunctional oligoribonuclease/PAP phosphatase NrnA [Lachnospiraceae bacterium]MDD7051351.1 bifunctional oligoribonuclease/PAP phosphatase NrnA [Lachnospiraceae bacterium]MDY3221674.1 bifunctional oligoribonuclease/PAP phosphatase NrnA [Lachnospiraceae bacterium]MDY4096501.1 bifunctional oligoribonuclease/PAP phosphatase NrnA [Lachnospiraceae bacterium]